MTSATLVIVFIGCILPCRAWSQATRKSIMVLPAERSSTDEQTDVDLPSALYVHIPYCRRRCRYCNFAIVPVGSGDQENNEGFVQMDQQYRQDLVKELQTQPHSPLQSIYFGGGTPSLAPIGTIQAVLEQVKSENSIEFTMEMDPGTFTKDHLQKLVNECGLNRISLGIQSFDDELLESMGRVHRRKDIFDSLKYLKEILGEDVNYSIDLISGLPGLTRAKWIETLQAAVALDPPPSHISVYDLQVEQNTVFGTWYKDQIEDEDDVRALAATSSSLSRLLLPSQKDCAFMYKFTAGYLKSCGYEHYEVSSYARPGRRSRHNQIYWDAEGQWNAVGVGATSMVRGISVARPRTIFDYHNWIESHGGSGGDETEAEDDDFLTDAIMKRLRTSDGLDLSWIRQRFGNDTAAQIVEGASLGLELDMITHDEKHQTLRLVDPVGFLYSNSLISSIFAELGYE